MSAELKFLGQFEYDDDDAMNEALFEAAELLEADDPDLKELLDHEGFIAVGHNRVSIELEVSVPSDWFVTLDEILATLAEYASGGQVDIWHEGEQMEPYLPGG